MSACPHVQPHPIIAHYPISISKYQNIQYSMNYTPCK